MAGTKGPHIGPNVTPARAVEHGFTHASIGPKGNILSYHASEHNARSYIPPTLRAMGVVVVALAALLPASAHDYWADGKKVPDWVKSSCCGPADAHLLRPDQVHDMGDYYLIDGYRDKISKKQTLPSQDGQYWAFYADYPASKSCSPEGGCYSTPASQSGVYCFFVPMDF